MAPNRKHDFGLLEVIMSCSHSKDRLYLDGLCIPVVFLASLATLVRVGGSWRILVLLPNLKQYIGWGPESESF